MRINGFIFQGYRSVSSAKPAVLFPLRSVNLIAGQNNAGKSNVLRAIADTYADDQGKRSRSKWDRPLGDAEHNFVRLEVHAISEILTWEGMERLSAEQLKALEDFLRLPGIAANLGQDQVAFGVSNNGVLDDQILKEYAREAGGGQLAYEL